MTPAALLHRPEKRPMDCWDWIAVEELPRLALTAWAMAKTSCIPPRGERFRDADDNLWSSRTSFADTLADCLQMLVRAEAYARGVPDGGMDEGFEQAALRAVQWNRPVSTTLPNASAGLEGGDKP